MTVVPNLLITTQSYLHAFHYSKDIDAKDTPYLAVAIEFDIELLTNDEELIEGLRKKGFEKVISLKELFDKLSKEGL